MKRTFLIVEPDPIVCMDLVSLLKQSFPTSDVTMVGTVAELRGQSGTLMPDCVFVNSLAARGQHLDDLARIAMNGGQIVFVGTPPQTDFAVTVVEMPFTSEMILNVLSCDAPDPPGHRPEAHT